GGARTGLSLLAFATFLIERVVDTMQGAGVSRQIDVVVYRALRRQVFRDRAPLTAGGENVHEPVHDLAHVHRALAAARLARRDQGLDELPLIVSQIARIAQLAAVVTNSVLRRPHRGDPPSESGHHP